MVIYIEIKSRRSHPQPSVELISSHLDGNPGSGVVGHVHNTLLTRSLLSDTKYFSEGKFKRQNVKNFSSSMILLPTSSTSSDMTPKANVRPQASLMLTLVLGFVLAQMVVSSGMLYSPSAKTHSISGQVLHRGVWRRRGAH